MNNYNNNILEYIQSIISYYNLFYSLKLFKNLLINGINGFDEHPYDEIITFPFLVKNDYENDNLSYLLKNKIPSLFNEIYNQKYNILLQSGNLQTILMGIVEDQEYKGEIKYAREILNLPDGGIISLDWVNNYNSNNNENILFILPGLTSSSDSQYVLSAIEHLHKNSQKYNNMYWKVVVLNYRGLSGMIVKTPKLYSASDTSDILYAVNHVNKKYPNSLIFGLGFSMGANLLSLLLAQENHPFCFGLSIGNPFDLLASSRMLEKGYFWSSILAKNLTTLFSRSDIIDVFKNDPNININEICNSNRLVDFDEALTRKSFGYRSTNDYYLNASSSNKLLDINVPYIAINSLDDPISSQSGLPIYEAKKNKNVYLFLTKHGGHLGWFENIFSLKKRWINRVIGETLTGILNLHQNNKILLYNKNQENEIINNKNEIKDNTDNKNISDDDILNLKKKTLRRSLSQKILLNKEVSPPNILLSGILKIISYIFPLLSITISLNSFLSRNQTKSINKHILSLILSILSIRIYKYLSKWSQLHKKHSLLS